MSDVKFPFPRTLIPTPPDGDPEDEHQPPTWYLVHSGICFVCYASRVLGLVWVWQSESVPDGDDGDANGRWALVHEQTGEPATEGELRMVRGYWAKIGE